MRFLAKSVDWFGASHCQRPDGRHDPVLWFVAAVLLNATPAWTGELVRVAWLEMPHASTPLQFPQCHHQRSGTPGKVELECRITADRHVTACSVILKQPADCSYGRTALGLVAGFRSRPRTLDGRGVVAGMRVHIPMSFQISD